MLFEELVEQHRVHCFVADGVRFAFVVAGHQVWIYFLYLLSHEAELWNAFGIELFLISESHRFERENRLARLVHWFYRVLETRRGDDRAELTVCLHINRDATGDGCPTDPRNKSLGVRSARAD